MTSPISLEVPLSVPYIDRREIEAVTNVLRSGWLTHGPKTAEFERLLAEYLGVRHALAMNSCTSALFLALLAQDIHGEVIIPSFTFVATANAVVTAGATPVFVDIEPDTCNMNPDAVAEAITPRTEAIIVVHFAGHPADMGPIMALAQRHGLAVIEDSAETLGGQIDDRKAGSFSTAAFSFFPTKNITCGEGGMLTSDDDALVQKVRALMAHGIVKSTHQRQHAERPWWREAQFAGFNFRLSNILAAVGVEQMHKLEAMNELRRSHADYLSNRLAAFEELELPIERPGYRHVYQMYTVKLNGVPRDRFVELMRQNSVAASVHFDPPVHLQEFYRPRIAHATKLPVTERVAASIVTLPMFPGMDHEQLDRIAETVGTSLANLRGETRQCA